MGNTMKREMIRYAKEVFKDLMLTEGDEWTFSVECAIWWFANDYHEGQWSELYSILSTSQYRPSPLSRSIEDEDDPDARMVYQALVERYVK